MFIDKEWIRNSEKHKQKRETVRFDKGDTLHILWRYQLLRSQTKGT